MKNKVMILILLTLMIATFSACNKEKNTYMDNNINNSSEIKENSSTGETMTDNNTVNDDAYTIYGEFLWDENTFFVCEHYVASIPKSGKVTMNPNFIDILEKQEDNDKILYAAILEENNGVGIYEFYNNYLKYLNIITEFTNKSEAEVNDLLKEKIEKENNTEPDEEIKSEVIIYATKKQLLELKDSICDNSIALYISAIKWPMVKLEKEHIEKYKGEILPVYYYIAEDGGGRCVDEFVSKDRALDLLESESVYHVYWSDKLMHDNPSWKHLSHYDIKESDVKLEENNIFNDNKSDLENKSDNISKNVYDFLYDPNVLWMKDGYSSMSWKPLGSKEGEVVIYEGFVEVVKKQENSDEILYAAELVFNIDVGIHSVYYDFLEKYGITSELTYKTDAEREKILSGMYSYYEKVENCYDIGYSYIIIYPTKEQLLNLNGLAISNNMELYIKAKCFPIYEITQNDIDYFKSEIMPVEYYKEVDGKSKLVSENLSKEEVQQLYDSDIKIYWQLDVVMDNYNWKNEY